jgi:hypothetical protein
VEEEDGAAPQSAFEDFCCASWAIERFVPVGFLAVSLPRALDQILPNASEEGFAAVAVYQINFLIMWEEGCTRGVAGVEVV